jgi:hypothetical protein
MIELIILWKRFNKKSTNKMIMMKIMNKPTPNIIDHRIKLQEKIYTDKKQ